MTLEPASYPRHRFPAEIIRHAVWLYHVFSLSLRDVELILAERGIVVTHESIRHWCLKLVPTSPEGYAGDGRSQETLGISMRCSSASRACCTICGERWIVSGAPPPFRIRRAQGGRSGAPCHGINSSTRFCGQPFTRRVSRSVK